MKRLLTALILAACVPAAFASTPTITPSDLAHELMSNESSYDTGFWAGVVLGFMQDPKVCVGSALVGSVQAQLAGEILNYTGRHPDKDMPMSLLDAGTTLVLEMMRADYPCK